MRLFCTSAVALVLAALAWAAPIDAQAPAENCRHAMGETPADAQRRDDALRAMRMINTALAQVPRSVNFPTWEALAQLPAVASMRGTGGTLGDLARKMQWGTPEPLPGWRVHYVNSARSYAVALADTTDSCGFTYYSNENGVITEGQPIRPRNFGIVPLR